MCVVTCILGREQDSKAHVESDWSTANLKSVSSKEIGMAQLSSSRRRRLDDMDSKHTKGAEGATCRHSGEGSPAGTSPDIPTCD